MILTLKCKNMQDMHCPNPVSPLRICFVFQMDSVGAVLKKCIQHCGNHLFMNTEGETDFIKEQKIVSAMLIPMPVNMQILC